MAAQKRSSNFTPKWLNRSLVTSSGRQSHDYSQAREIGARST